MSKLSFEKGKDLFSKAKYKKEVLEAMAEAKKLSHDPNIKRFML